jgi:hypothetical protein
MLTRRFVIPALASLGVFGGAAWSAAAATTFDVNNSGMSAFVIDGVNNPTLTLTRGQTYTFTVSSVGHPFWITTARGAGDTEANAFSQGVTGNGASPGTVSFGVPASAPATLFYQCAFHDPMGGTLNVVTAAAPVPSVGPAALAALVGLLLFAAVAALRRRVRVAGRSQGPVQ